MNSNFESDISVTKNQIESWNPLEESSENFINRLNISEMSKSYLISIISTVKQIPEHFIDINDVNNESIYHEVVTNYTNNLISRISDIEQNILSDNFLTDQEKFALTNVTIGVSQMLPTISETASQLVLLDPDGVYSNSSLQRFGFLCRAVNTVINVVGNIVEGVVVYIWVTFQTNWDSIFTIINGDGSAILLDNLIRWLIATGQVIGDIFGPFFGTYDCLVGPDLVNCP